MHSFGVSGILVSPMSLIHSPFAATNFLGVTLGFLQFSMTSMKFSCPQPCSSRRSSAIYSSSLLALILDDSTLVVGHHTRALPNFPVDIVQGIGYDAATTPLVGLDIPCDVSSAPHCKSGPLQTYVISSRTLYVLNSSGLVNSAPAVSSMLASQEY